MNDGQQTQQINRSHLLLVLDRLNLNYGSDERDDYWALHDLLTKLARNYDQQADVAQAYLTKKDRYILTQPKGQGRFEKIWLALEPRGKDSRFRLNPHFAVSVERRYAAEMRRRQDRAAAQERASASRKAPRGGAG